MQTPTINKTQKKSTLSAKKVRTKETIKNVLASPYDNSYWPQILPEDRETLKTVLQNNLPRIKCDKVNVPWKLLKSVPKSERKEFRKKHNKHYEMRVNKTDSEGLIIGINDTSRFLEKNLIGAVLISNDVQPRIMVQHIIDQCVLYRVPIIVFDDLRGLVFKHCGVGSAVVGIRKDVTIDSKLNFIKENIRQIYEKYPPPSNHINYKRSLQEPVNMEVACENTEKDKTETKDTIIPDKLASSIYLKRESKNKRVFVPKPSQEDMNIPKMEVDSMGFLPFSDSSAVVDVKKSNTLYKSLIVKRLKGDPNRNKRKIETMKSKSK